MKSPLLRWLAVIAVNVGILAAIELISARIIRKHFKNANAAFQRESVVDQPFALSTAYEMRANATLGDSSTRIRTDERGRAIVPDALPNAAFTLAVLGGSSMFGVGVSDNAANVPSQLQTVLRSQYGLDVNVINLSARGYISFQEMLVLNQFLAERPLDMAVSVSGHNDLMRYIRGNQNPTYLKRPDCSAVLLVRRAEAGNLVIANVIPTLRRLSQTANLVALAMERQEATQKRERKKLQLEKVPAPADLEMALEDQMPETPTPREASVRGKTPLNDFFTSHLAHYAMMKAGCDTHQTYFKLFFQPSAFTKAQLSEKEKNQLLKACGGSQQKLDARILAHRSYRSTFDALPKPFPYTDLAEIFGPANTSIYLDSCHYEAAGCSLLAQALAADLAPIIRSRLEARKSLP